MSLHNLRKESMRDGDILIDRRTIFGNPYHMTKVVSRDAACTLYETYARARVQKDPKFAAAVKGLQGKRLFCWCAPARCHGETLERLCKEMNNAG